jgi:hypothetical protein
MAYAAFSVVFGEQPSAAKWNILGTNDAGFDTYIGDGTNAIQQRVYNQTGAVATGTGTIPFDNTIPQITEGTEFMTQAITPKSATNILEIDVRFFGGLTGSANDFTVALFQDSISNALAVNCFYDSDSGARFTTGVKHSMVAGTTSSTTFRVRAGGSSAGTLTFNGSGGARLYGGVAASSITITEYKV